MRLALLLIASLLTAACGVSVATAQIVRWGLRTGVTVASTPSDIQRFEYAARNYELSVHDVKVGFHGGLVLQARLGKIALQPEVLFHSSRTDYRLDELFNGQILETIRTERYSHIEVPIMVGYRWGPVRLQAGPVGRAYVASSSEFVGIADYLDDPSDFALGYQAGIGFDIRRILVDIKYDGNFDGTSSHVLIGGRDIAFSDAGGRTFLTLGFLFN